MRASRRFSWRWPVRLAIAGLALLLTLRVIGGLMLEALVDWQSESGYRGRQIAEALVLSSPRLFGRSALPALGRIFDDRPRLEVEAYSAIARLRPGRAWRLLDERASAPPPAAGWWVPPSPPPELVDLLARGFGQEAAGAPPEELDPWWLRQLQKSCLLEDEDGSVLVIFPHPYLGGSADLWLYRPGRPRSEPVFVGDLLGREHHESDLRLRCALLEEDTVELAWSDLDEYPPVTPPPPALLALSELAADSDGDGLTDRVERRLFTDPMAHDTDGDGVVDLADPSPNGGRAPAPESVDAAIDELLRTLFAFWDPTCGRRTVIYVLSEPGSERWARGCGPTVNLPASEVETQPRGVDILVIEPYGERWGRFGSKSTPPGSVGDVLEAVARPGAIRLLVVNDHVRSDSEGYEVQLRRHDGRWQLIWFKNLWI